MVESRAIATEVYGLIRSNLSANSAAKQAAVSSRWLPCDEVAANQ